MKFLLIFFVFFSFGYANTKNMEKLEKYNQYDDIFLKYEKEFGISYFLMKSIALTENAGFDNDAIMKNENGTIDIGLMQINSMWKYWLPEENITHQKLKDPDFNIKIAYTIVSKIIEQHGYSWDSIGRYHSGTPKFKERWLNKIKKNVSYLASLDNRVALSSENFEVEKKSKSNSSKSNSSKKREKQIPKKLIIKEVLIARN